MDLRKNAQSLSFIIYGLVALSLFVLYNGFSTLYGNVLADFIIRQTQNILVFDMGYANATTLLLIGTIIFFVVRYIASRLEAENIINPGNAIRFWILGGIILIASLFAVVDLFTIISGVISGRSDIINLFVTLVTLTTASVIIIFCISEIKRQDNLRFVSSQSFLFLVFCVVSFSLGFFIAPPWTGREVRDDQKQLQRMEGIKSALANMHTNKKNLPDSLEDIQSNTIKDREAILDGVTQQPYKYKRLSDSSYELCAEFLTDYESYRRYRLFPSELIVSHPHHKGQTCYKIDLSLEDTKTPYYAD